MSTSSLLVHCKSCQHEFRAPQRLAGKKVNCPYCGRILTVGDPSSASNMSTGGDILVGKVIRGCELKRRLGAGSMGAVYEAHYIKGNRTVAVKLLSSKASKCDDLVKRFEREARLCKSIDHPNVIDVYDIGVEKKKYYMIMEYIDGNCLASLIDDRGQIPWKEAAEMMRTLAGALAKANELDIIHRDIKPANILISSQGKPMLADLGLGKQLNNEDDFGLTMQGTAMGTPAYMAPEQITDASNVTPAADVYGLGATFYHVIAGRRPYEGASAAEILSKLRTEDPEELKDLVPDVPQGMNDLIMQMIEKKPGNRPAHPQVLIQEIDATFAAPAKARQRRARRTAGRQQQKKKSSTSALLIIIIVLALIAIGVYFTLRASAPPGA